MRFRMKTGMTVKEVHADLPRRTWRGILGFTIAGEYDQQMIGTIGSGGAPFSVSYFLEPAFWGQRFMTEALSAFIPAVLDRFTMSGLSASYFENNLTGDVFLEKLGFQKIGSEMGTSQGRLEPAPIIKYALTGEMLKVPA